MPRPPQRPGKSGEVQGIYQIVSAFAQITVAPEEGSEVTAVLPQGAVVEALEVREAPWDAKGAQARSVARLASPAGWLDLADAEACDNQHLGDSTSGTACSSSTPPPQQANRGGEAVDDWDGWDASGVTKDPGADGRHGSAGPSPPHSDLGARRGLSPGRSPASEWAAPVPRPAPPPRPGTPEAAAYAGGLDVAWGQQPWEESYASPSQLSPGIERSPTGWYAEVHCEPGECGGAGFLTEDWGEDVGGDTPQPRGVPETSVQVHAVGAAFTSEGDGQRADSRTLSDGLRRRERAVVVGMGGGRGDASPTAFREVQSGVAVGRSDSTAREGGGYVDNGSERDDYPTLSVLLEEYGIVVKGPLQDLKALFRASLARGGAAKGGSLAGGDPSADGVAAESEDSATPKAPLSARKFWNIGDAVLRFCEALPGVVVVLVLLTVSLTLGLGLAFTPVSISADFDSFLKTDVSSSVIWDAFLSARSWGSGEPSGRRLQEGNWLLAQRDIILVYELQEAGLRGGIFHDVALFGIDKFEKRLKGLEGWIGLCSRTAEGDDRLLCDPGASFVNYVFASSVAGGGKQNVTLDGKGETALPVKAAIMLAEKNDVKDLFLPAGFSMTAVPHATTLRSAFRFKARYAKSTDPFWERRAALRRLERTWEDFLVSGLLPVLREGPSTGSTSPSAESEDERLLVRYDGSGIFGLEVMEALSKDMLYAILSGAFVLFYTFAHSGSLLVSAIGLTVSVASVPLAFLICAGFGANTVSVASFLAVFLAVGFGCDTLFVYTDFWSASAKACEAEDLSARLAWVARRGGAASGATAVTTALSFFANMVSVVRALRQFGFFMGLCVVFAWVNVSITILPLCVWRERRWRNSRGCCCRCACSMSFSCFFALYSKHVHRWRWFYVVLFALLVGIFIGSSVQLAKVVAEQPAVFPEDHDRSLMQKAEGVSFIARSQCFDRSFKPPPLRAPVCAFEDVLLWSKCDLSTCEASRDLAVPYAGVGSAPTVSCPCFRQMWNESCPTEMLGKVVLRIGLPEGAEVADGNSALPEAAIRHLVAGGLASGDALWSGRSLPPMLVSEWSSGESELSPQVEFRADIRRVGGRAQCGYLDQCFCSRFRCTMDIDWELVESIEVPSASISGSGSAQPLRRLQGLSPAEPITWVFVVFGIQVSTVAPTIGTTDPSEQWDFDPFFDVANPWTQRRVMDVCEALREESTLERLRLKESAFHCWMASFEKCRLDRGLRFPSLAWEFHEAASDCGTSSWMWLQSGKVIALSVSAGVRLVKDAPYDQVLKLKQEWDGFLSTTAPGTFHASILWVNAETTHELLWSTASTLAILLVVALLVMLVFTRSMTLSVLVCICTLTVLSSLLFFVTVAMRWDLGLLEGVATIYFAGYAVTISLHVAHAYSEAASFLDATPPSPTSAGASPAEGAEGAAERPSGRPLVGFKSARVARFRRTTCALQGIGGVTLGSGSTTIGASFFLCFCTLRVFQRLGAMCLVVTLAAVVVSFIPLPAALMVFGPSGMGSWCCCRCSLRRRIRSP